MTDYYEKQYHILDDTLAMKGLCRFGPMSSFTWNNDPKRLLFVLSRYKSTAKILEGSRNVIEIGCGDGFAARIIRQSVENLLITDIDPKMIKYAQELQSNDYPVKALCHDFCNFAMSSDLGKFDAAYMLDVLEHIPQDNEEKFFTNLSKSLQRNAKVVVGIPSIESQIYASPGSKEGHINCKSKEELAETLKNYFSTVTCFSMNDEVLHTGFNRMSQYLLAVCTF